MENSASAILNFEFNAPDRSASISAFVLYNFGVALNTDFFATKNLPSDGSIPAKIAVKVISGVKNFLTKKVSNLFKFLGALPQISVNRNIKF